MNDVIEKEDIKIKDMIYEIRGVEVMLDSDLAKLYCCKNGTKEINQAVNRNPDKFPKKYCWILNDEESKNLLVTICDQKIEKRGGKYKNPRVFTEQAVAMLATILRTPQAVKTSLAIMDAFVAMRHYIIENKDVYKSLNTINNKLLEHDDKLNYLFSKFDRKERVLLTGEKYNAYSNIIDILNSSESEIIVIDPYADIILLSLLEDIKSSIILITNNSDRLNNQLIEKYNKKNNNLKVIRDNNFHDRFIIIDKKDYYHFGTSINSLGEKISMIIKLEDSDVKNIIQNNLGGINE